MSQKYAAYETDPGPITAFYDSVDSPVPVGVSAIAITDAEWQTCINQQGQWDVSGGALAAVPAPTETELVAAAQAAQIATLTASYEAAITTPVSFTTAAGASAMFNQTDAAKTNLQNAIDGSMSSGKWAINLWLDVNSNPITPFTYADLQGLAEAMEAVDAPDYQELLALIGQVTAATTVTAVQAIVWP
jgi:hypothetical protein